MTQLTFPPGPLKRGTQLALETESHQISFESVFPLKDSENEDILLQYYSFCSYF